MSKPLLAAAAAILLGFGVLWWLHSHRDEARIRRALAGVIAVCEKSDAKSLLANALHAEEIATYFTPDAVLHIGPPYPMQVRRSELPALLARGRGYVETLTISTRGDEIAVAPDRRTAVMNVTIEVRVTIDGQEDSGIGEYRIRWMRVDRAWKIDAVDHVETIHRPDALGIGP